MAFTNNSLALATKALVDRFKNNLAGLPTILPVTRIKFINAPFTTPNNQNWARVSINNFGPIDQDASAKYEINQGVFTVSYFVPKGTGYDAAMDMAHAIKALYTAEIFDDVVVTSVLVNESSEPESSPWYGINISINYQFEGMTS